MKTLGSFLASILILGILAAIVWGSILGIKFLLQQYNLLGSELASSMIIASALLLLCSFILAAAIRFNKTRNDKHIQPEKAYIYSDFINYYITIRESIRKEGIINYRFRSDITLWAGKNVLNAYLQFNKYIDELNPDNSKILEQAEKVIYEMRRDLGNDNYGFNKGDLDKLIFPEDTKAVNDNETVKIKTP